MMTLTNELQRALGAGGISPEAGREAAERLVVLLAPMAPHIAEELWREPLGHEESVILGGWPDWDEDLTREEEVVLVVQVDGRVRDRLTVSAAADESLCREAALASERVRRALDGREIARVIVRAPKLVNVVTQ